MWNRKPDLSVWCDGVLLTSQVSWGDLAYSHAWPNGCHTASWSITRRHRERPRMLRRGVLTEITCGGWPIWAGILDAPDWNGHEAQMKAIGLYKLGEAYMAFAADGSTTDNPTTAIENAQDRGLPWLIGSGVPNTAYATGTTDPVNSILDLMEAFSEKNGHRWGVDGRRFVNMSADPTTPSLMVPAGIVDLGQSSQEYRSRIVLRYEHTSGEYRTMWWPGVTMPDTSDWTDNEEMWSYVEWPRDVTDDVGPISDADAQSLAEQLYNLSGGNPAWSNGLSLTYGQLLNMGGEAVDPAFVREGVMVRVFGVPNELTGANHIDMVVGETAYSHGQPTIGLNPVGIVVNSPESAWQKLFESGGTA